MYCLSYLLNQAVLYCILFNHWFTTPTSFLDSLLMYWKQQGRMNCSVCLVRALAFCTFGCKTVSHAHVSVLFPEHTGQGSGCEQHSALSLAELCCDCVHVCVRVVDCSFCVCLRLGLLVSIDLKKKKWIVHKQKPLVNMFAHTYTNSQTGLRSLRPRLTTTPRGPN